MEVSCKYKVSSTMDMAIGCRLRYPFDQALTADEKKEIVYTIGTAAWNVPPRYEEIHNAIKNLKLQSRVYMSKSMALITKADGSCYIDIVLEFSSFAKFQNFIQENKLTAMLF